MTWRNLLSDRRGAVAILVAVALPVLISFAGLGIETGLWYAIKYRNLAAADAAAWSAGMELSKGKTCTSMSQLAVYAASRNEVSTFPTSSLASGFNGCTNSSNNCQVSGAYTMCVNNPPATGPHANDTNYVEVTLRQQQTALLAALDLPSVTIGSRSVAGLVKSYACVEALDGTSSGAVTLTNDSTVELAGCWVATNSTSTTPIVTGSGLTQSTVCAYNYAVGTASWTADHPGVTDCTSPATGTSSIKSTALTSVGGAVTGPSVNLTEPTVTNGDCQQFGTIALANNSSSYPVGTSQFTVKASGKNALDPTKTYNIADLNENTTGHDASIIPDGTTAAVACTSGCSGNNPVYNVTLQNSVVTTGTIVASTSCSSSNPCDSIQFTRPDSLKPYDSASNPHPYCAPVGLTNGQFSLTAGTYYIYGEGNQNTGFGHKNINLNGVALYAGSKATITSNGAAVTFVIFGDSAQSAGVFDVNCSIPFVSGGSMALTAPSSDVTTSLGGTIPSGMLFYQDPAHADTAAGSGNGNTTNCPVVQHGGTNPVRNVIVWGSTNNVTVSSQAIIYTPATEFDFSGSTTLCTVLVANDISFGNVSSVSTSLIYDETTCTIVQPPTVQNVAALAE